MKTCIQNLAVNDIHRFIFQWCGRILKWMFWRPNCIKNFTKAQSLKFTTNERTKKTKTWFKPWFVFIWSLIRSLAIKEQCSFCQIEWYHIKWHLLNVIQNRGLYKKCYLIFVTLQDAQNWIIKRLIILYWSTVKQRTMCNHIHCSSKYPF